MLPYLHYQPNIKNIRKAYIVLLCIALIIGIINILIGSNYLYTAYLPLPKQIIAWPYYIPLLTTFALFAGRVPYYVYFFLAIRFAKQTSNKE